MKVYNYYSFVIHNNFKLYFISEFGYHCKTTKYSFTNIYIESIDEINSFEYYYSFSNYYLFIITVEGLRAFHSTGLVHRYLFLLFYSINFYIIIQRY
jgi:hypothetical protein